MHINYKYLLFVILVVLEEIYQAGKQVNLWKIEQCVVNINSAVIKLEELGFFLMMITHITLVTSILLTGVMD